MLNIAERIKAHYDSDDFESNYFECLFEDRHAVIDRIIELFNVNDFYVRDELSNHFRISRKQAELIYEFILDDLESFTSRYHHAYVGYTSIDSVSFGEQEEQLTGLYNHRTGKDYTLPYLRKIFSKDFYVNDDDCAYYDMSYDGLNVDILKNAKALDDFLLTIRTEEQLTELVTERLTA